MSQTASLLSNPSVSLSVMEGVRVGVIAFLTLLAIPAGKALWSIASTWGEMVAGQREAKGKLDDLTHPVEGVVARVTRTEFILTGDKGENGVRGDVKLARAEVQEVKKTLFTQNETLHTTLGRFENRVAEVERRTAKPRRKTPRVTRGRRNGE